MLETGAVISGPPLRPLGRIDVEIRDDGMIWAIGRSHGMRVSEQGRRSSSAV
jgi:hypothetical protein